MGVAVIISLHNVEKLYPPDQHALQQVSVRVHEGEFVFVAGASGAGKSTLLKLLYGAERPSGGEVVVAGRNMMRMTRHNVAELRRDLGIIFQDYKLLPRRTVLDNVAFGLEVRGVAARDRRALARKMLKLIALEDRAEAFPLSLSGGEQQRVAVARALLPKPRIVLADEPTGNLDPTMSARVFDLLLEANARGVTVLVATHDLGMIEELNVRTIVFDRGKILGDFSKPGRVE